MTLSSSRSVQKRDGCHRVRRFQQALRHQTFPWMWPLGDAGDGVHVTSRYSDLYARVSCAGFGSESGAMWAGTHASCWSFPSFELSHKKRSRIYDGETSMHCIARFVYCTVHEAMVRRLFEMTAIRPLVNLKCQCPNESVSTEQHAL